MFAWCVHFRLIISSWINILLFNFFPNFVQFLYDRLLLLFFWMYIRVEVLRWKQNANGENVYIKFERRHTNDTTSIFSHFNTISYTKVRHITGFWSCISCVMDWGWPNLNSFCRNYDISEGLTIIAIFISGWNTTNGWSTRFVDSTCFA